MINEKTQVEKKKPLKSFEIDFDERSQMPRLHIFDVEGMFPFILDVEDIGTYRVIRTRQNRLQMIK